MFCRMVYFKDNKVRERRFTVKTIKGPGIFLAQFLGDKAPFDNLENICQWVAELGYKFVQIPCWDLRVIDLKKAAGSKNYCDELKGKLKKMGIRISELAAHLQGQVIACNPQYGVAFDAFYPKGLNDKDRCEWSQNQLKMAIKASVNLGLKTIPTMSGGFLWPFVYPWPQRPKGLVEQATEELVKRWKPVLDFARDNDVSFSYEPHPASDIMDGLSFERFREATGNNEAVCLIYDPSHFVLQALDYLEFIRIYAEFIRSFHVKDAELRCDGRVGVYGGYAEWNQRAGRFRSLGDGQVDFSRIFTLLTELLAEEVVAVLEWECCVKDKVQGAIEGAPFIEQNIIQVATTAFDDFAGGKTDPEKNKKILGLA